MLVDLLTSRFNPHKWGRLTKSRRKNEGSSEVMHITDIMRGGDSPTFSFEFFPPKTAESAEILYQSIRDLESYMPHFVSVTYGAGGSTRDLTHDLVERIQTSDAEGTAADSCGGANIPKLWIRAPKTHNAAVSARQLFGH